MVYEIYLIPDDHFTRQGQFHKLKREKSDKFISIAPAQHENYGHFGWWKLKLAAEDLGYEVRAYTHMNHLPLAFPMADVLFLSRKKDYVWEMYKEKSSTGALTFHWFDLPNEVGADACEIQRKYRPTPLKEEVAEAAKNVTLERMLERFATPKVYVRQSTYDLFQSMSDDLPEHVFMCEPRQDYNNQWGCPEVRMLHKVKMSRPIIGMDHKFQRSIISKVGDHWAGFQILGSILKDWLYICIAGSSNLHCVLPTRCIFMKDALIRNYPILRQTAIYRLGKAGHILPFIGREFRYSNEIAENLEIIEEGVRMLEKPEIVFRDPEIPNSHLMFL